VEALAAHQRKQQRILGDHQDAIRPKRTECCVQHTAEQPAVESRAFVDSQKGGKSGFGGVEGFGGNDGPAVHTQLTFSTNNSNTDNK
jgi:hypothetical protein